MGAFCGAACPQRWGRDRQEKPPLPAPRRLVTDSARLPNWWDVLRPDQSLAEQFDNYLVWVREGTSGELQDGAERLFAQTGMAGRLVDWQALAESVRAEFAGAIRHWRDDYEPLLKAWTGTDQRAQANAFRYQLQALHELTVIEALADRQFLPRYGFPIGVHKLRVIAPDADRPRIREEDQYRLERGSLLALGEYVPGSQLLVGGRLVTSHGLLKHWTGADLDSCLGLRGQYCHCGHGHFHYWIEGAEAACPLCGAPPGESPRALLYPRHGFSSAAWDPPRWSTDVERVGEAETATITFTEPAAGRTDLVQSDFGGVSGLIARYREDGELLVYNEGGKGLGFAICLACGYADSEQQLGQGTLHLPTRFRDHPPLTSPGHWNPCWRDETVPVLRNQTLAAHETTDVLLIDFSDCLGSLARSEPLVLSLAYALRRAGAQLLELDSRELGVLIVPAGLGGVALGAVVYDNVPGGAGHVAELLALGRDWLAAARGVLFVSETHDARCETACLDCLLSFDAQDLVARNLLQRRAALAVLDALLTGAPLPELPSAPPATASPAPSAARAPEHERLAGASERLRHRPSAGRRRP
jgi:hypothetical protein